MRSRQQKRGVVKGEPSNAGEDNWSTHALVDLVSRGFSFNNELIGKETCYVTLKMCVYAIIEEIFTTMNIKIIHRCASSVASIKESQNKFQEQIFSNPKRMKHR